MSKKRKIYWLCREVLPAYRGRALMLQPEGFEVHFRTSLSELQEELRHRRAGVVVISDDRSVKENDANIRAVAEMPEVKGARLILALEKGHPYNLKIAAGLSYRDFIPLRLDDDQWIKRFKYAVAGQDIPYVQPVAQVSTNNPSNLSVPCRVVWIGKSEIRIESRVTAPVGAKLKVAGSLAAKLGMKHLTISITEQQNSRLHYRFSDAIVGRVLVSPETKPRLDQLIDDLCEEGNRPVKRAFVAVKSPGLRGQLLSKLARDDFIVTSALHVQSMVNEPRYLTPDIVLTEASLTEGTFENRFARMIDGLGPKTVIVILGATPEQTEQLKKRFAPRHFLFVDGIGADFDSQVLAKIAPLPAEGQEAAKRDVYHIPPDSDLSYGEIQTSARMRTIHPSVIHFASSFEIGKFGVVRIISPILKAALGRGAWVKVTDSHRLNKEGIAPHVYASEGYLMDIAPEDSTRLAQNITELVTKQFSKFVQGESDVQSDAFDASGRSTEFGDHASSQAAQNRDEAAEAVALDQLDQPSSIQEIADALPFETEEPIAMASGDEIASNQGHEAYRLAGGSQSTSSTTRQSGMGNESIDRRADSRLTSFRDPSGVSPVVRRSKEYQDFGDKAREAWKEIAAIIFSRTFLKSVAIIAAVAFTFAALLGLAYTYSERKEKSGEAITDSLHKFAPKMKEKKRSGPVPFQRPSRGRSQP